MNAQKRSASQTRDRWAGRLVAEPIVKRLCELSDQYRAARDRTEKCFLEKRIRKLESYVIVLLSHKSREADRADVVLEFARKLLPNWKASWTEFKQEVDEFQKRISARSRGKPVVHRRGVVEAWERKLADPKRTWDELAQDFQLESDYLKREKERLRALLKQERITVSSPPR